MPEESFIPSNHQLLISPQLGVELCEPLPFMLEFLLAWSCECITVSLYVQWSCQFFRKQFHCRCPLLLALTVFPPPLLTRSPSLVGSYDIEVPLKGESSPGHQLVSNYPPCMNQNKPFIQVLSSPGMKQVPNTTPWCLLRPLLSCGKAPSWAKSQVFTRLFILPVSWSWTSQSV